LTTSAGTDSRTPTNSTLPSPSSSSLTSNELAIVDLCTTTPGKTQALIKTQYADDLGFGGLLEEPSKWRARNDAS